VNVHGASTWCLGATLVIVTVLTKEWAALAPPTSSIRSGGDFGPILLPLLIASGGIICSNIGTFFVKTREGGKEIPVYAGRVRQRTGELRRALLDPCTRVSDRPIDAQVELGHDCQQMVEDVRLNALLGHPVLVGGGAPTDAAWIHGDDHRQDDEARQVGRVVHSAAGSFLVERTQSNMQNSADLLQ
jgi:hypothetical protein